MDILQKCRQFLRDYRFALLFPIYGIFYLICFQYLERTVTKYKIIHMAIDDYIPFCEYFVIPYYLWFFFIAAAVIYFMFAPRREYYQLVISLMIGMTVFLIVSYVYPNGQNLRPEVFARDNIFVDMVKLLYKADTPTNILPSIHVYNTLAIHIAISNNAKLSANRWILGGSYVLSVLIILSTIFLKQHSMLDLITGVLMAAVVYQLVYKFEYVKIREKFHAHREKQLLKAADKR